MDGKRSSEVIDKELQELRGKLRALEAEKQDHLKALEKAKADRKRSAYSAHSDKDAKAQERLAKARAAQRESELALEDLESAISEGRQRFDALQKEYEVAYRAEEWEKVLALAAEAQKEAENIDAHIDGLSKFLAQHQQKIEDLKRRSNNLGFPRTFETCGVRHVFRIMEWRLIQAGVSSETEKPSPAYRSVKGYAEIFGQQVEAAKARATTQNSGAAEADGAEAEAT